MRLVSYCFSCFRLPSCPRCYGQGWVAKPYRALASLHNGAQAGPVVDSEALGVHVQNVRYGKRKEKKNVLLPSEIVQPLELDQVVCRSGFYVVARKHLQLLYSELIQPFDFDQVVGRFSATRPFSYEYCKETQQSVQKSPIFGVCVFGARIDWY